VETIRAFLSRMTNTDMFSEGVLFPEPPAGAGRCRRSDDRCPDGAGAVLACDHLSLLAGRPPRSGRGAALRVSPSPPRRSTRALSVRDRAPFRAGRRPSRYPQKRGSRRLVRPVAVALARARRGPASRLCCRSPACWKSPIPARSMSAVARHRDLA
jgi:hypothetical protein